MSTLIISSKSYYGFKYLSGIQNKKIFSKTKQHFVNLLDDQDKSKFLVRMQNNKLHHEVEDFGNPNCCAKSSLESKI